MDKMETISKMRTWAAAKRFLIIFLPLAGLIIGVTMIIYHSEVRGERVILETNQANKVDLVIKFIAADLDAVVSDLMIIAEHRELKAMLESGKVGHRRALAQEFLTFSKHKRLYDQICFLDETGMEIVRVNFNSGKSVIVPQKQLQSKEKRYYFQETFKLRQAEVFVSPFDLNIGKGRIEQPLKPIIRFGTPIFDKNSRKRGIVIVNYLGEKMLRDLERASGRFPGQVMLINSDGFWIKGPRPEDEWGFMYEDEAHRTFEKAFPAARQRIFAAESGQFLNAEGLFTFATVHPLLEAQQFSTGLSKPLEPSARRLEGEEYYWKILSRVPKAILSAGSGQILDRIIMLDTALVLLITVGSWLLVRANVRRREAEEALQRAHDGLKRRVEERTAQLTGANQELRGQIDERRRTEEALCESEGRFRKAFEHAALGMALVNPTGRLLKVNLYLCQMWGYTEEELLTKTFNDLTHPDDQHIGIEVMQKLLDNTLSFARVEKRYLHKDGSTIWALLGTSLLRDSAGKPLYLVSHIQNISERKQAEEALKESEKRFRDLAENSPVGIFIVQNNQIVYTNPEQKRLFGPLPEPFAIDNFFKNVHPYDLVDLKEFYDTILSGDARGLDMEMRFFPFGKQTHKKETQWVHCRASLIEYRGDRAILFNMVDITRARELEQLVMIRGKMASLGHVAAGVAHEIRNPLSGINVFLDAIRENFEDPESASEIKKILRQTQGAANKIESVIKRVLDFSRPNMPSLRLADINLPVKEAIKLSYVTLRKSRIKIESALNGDLPRVYIDPQLIEQVMLNLITNASEAMEDIQGPKNISISSTTGKDNVVIEVSDAGQGIAIDSMEKIFDPFYTTKSNGSGIGLSLCQRIIADHGGTIEVSASKLGGAEFTIRIPKERRKTRR